MIAAPTDAAAALQRCHPDAKVIDGTDPPVIEVPGVLLPAGWSEASTTIWFVVPAGYPAAQPDCFWADASLRLAGGGMPQNSGLQAVASTGVPGLWFSWHLQSWRPGRDDLVTYTRFILRRLADAR